jgi:hypothetical protein
MPEVVKVNCFAPSRPHPNQLRVLEDPSRFKLLRAGRKWRKSSLGYSWLAEQALMDTLGRTYAYILPFQDQARDSIWNDHAQRLLRELDAKGVPYSKNETSMAITFPSHGRLKLYGSDNEKALRSVSNWGAIVVDEFDDCSESLWELTLRPNLMVHRAPAIVMGTPKGKRNMYRLEQDGRFTPFHYTSYDNPDLDPLELEEMVEDYRARGEDYFQQEVMAEYRKPVGLVYREWDEITRFVPVAYDPRLPLHITFDWGINDPTSVIWIQPYASEIRVIDYYEASDANIEHFVSVINSKPYRPADFYAGDPAGKARTLTTGTSVIDILAKKGIHVRTKDGVTIPEQIRSAHGYMPRLFVDSDRASRFRDCLLNYRYPAKRDTAVNQENETPIHDQYSHAMRAFEYWCVNAGERAVQRTVTVRRVNRYDRITGRMLS